MVTESAQLGQFASYLRGSTDPMILAGVVDEVVSS